jgi:hypothetical protein
MNDLSKILNNGELVIKNHNQLVYLLNELIIENRKLFEKLNYDVQQKFGFEMYRMKLFKFEQVDDVFAKSMFQPFELGKQMATLVEAFKDLLKSNLSLQIHHNVIEQRQKAELEDKINLFKVKLGSSSSSTSLKSGISSTGSKSGSSGSSGSGSSGSPTPYTLHEPSWWLPGATAVTGSGTKLIKDQYNEHLDNLINPLKDKVVAKEIKDAYDAIVELLTIIYKNSSKFGVTYGVNVLDVSFNDIKTAISTSKSLPDSSDGLKSQFVITSLFTRILTLFKLIFETLYKKNRDNTISAINNATGLTLSVATFNNIIKNLQSSTTTFSDLFNRLKAGVTGTPGKPGKKGKLAIPAILAIDLSSDTTTINYDSTILTGGALNNEDPYYEKYLKYKAKYNTLKKQLEANKISSV